MHFPPFTNDADKQQAQGLVRAVRVAAETAAYKLVAAGIKGGAASSIIRSIFVHQYSVPIVYQALNALNNSKDNTVLGLMKAAGAVLFNARSREDDQGGIGIIGSNPSTNNYLTNSRTNNVKNSFSDLLLKEQRAAGIPLALQETAPVTPMPELNEEIKLVGGKRRQDPLPRPPVQNLPRPQFRYRALPPPAAIIFKNIPGAALSSVKTNLANIKAARPMSYVESAPDQIAGAQITLPAVDYIDKLQPPKRVKICWLIRTPGYLGVIVPGKT